MVNGSKKAGIGGTEPRKATHIHVIHSNAGARSDAFCCSAATCHGGGKFDLSHRLSQRATSFNQGCREFGSQKAN